jgi:hypothetical protein
MWKKFSKLVGSRLLVVCSLLMGSRLLVELGSKVGLFIFLLWSKVVRFRLLAEVVEFCLMLGSKVVESRVRGRAVLSVVLLSLFLNKCKAEVVLLIRVEGMATRGGQARLSRAEFGETENDGQGLLLQVEEVAPGELKEVMLYMDGQAKLSIVEERDNLEQIGVGLGEEVLTVAWAGGEEFKINEGLLRVELGVGLEEFLTGTGRVLVDTLADLEDFNGFFFISFLFSALRVLLSVLHFLRFSERLSIF